MRQRSNGIGCGGAILVGIGVLFLIYLGNAIGQATRTSQAAHAPTETALVVATDTPLSATDTPVPPDAETASAASNATALAADAPRATDTPAPASSVLITAADLRNVPALGATRAEFVARFGTPHYDGPDAYEWDQCPDGSVPQLKVFFEKGGQHAWEIARDYCAPIPDAAAQRQEAAAFFPADAYLKSPQPSDLEAQTQEYSSGMLATDLDNPVWVWGGTPGTFQIQTDDQQGQWIMTPGH